MLLSLTCDWLECVLAFRQVKHSEYPCIQIQHLREGNFEIPTSRFQAWHSASELLPVFEIMARLEGLEPSMLARLIILGSSRIARPCSGCLPEPHSALDPTVSWVYQFPHSRLNSLFRCTAPSPPASCVRSGYTYCVFQPHRLPKLEFQEVLAPSNT